MLGMSSSPRHSTVLQPAEEFEREVTRELDSGLSSEPATKKFALERWSEIGFDLNTEWLIKGVLPTHGVGLIYGKSQSFKSFVAMHMALCVSTKRLWAGKRVEQASVVYIAAEGAAGLRKRKAGYVKAWPDPPDEVDFHLVPAAPNLGVEEGDRQAPIGVIEGAGVKPGLIVIDTVAKAIGAADENGQGMAALLSNAEALSRRFGCLVLCVHHVGHSKYEQTRPRGWSGLPAALDVMILSDRPVGAMEAALTIQKLKDDASDFSMTARLSRVVLGNDRDGDEVSTLVVKEVVRVESVAKTTAPRPISKSERLLMDAIANAIDEAGEEIYPYPADPLRVRAVNEQNIRERYFDRVAEKVEEDEDKEKASERNRKNFKNALKRVIDAQVVVAAPATGSGTYGFPDRARNRKIRKPF
jgi:hypothetical protein